METDDRRQGHCYRDIIKTKRWKEAAKNGFLYDCIAKKRKRLGGFVP